VGTAQGAFAHPMMLSQILRHWEFSE